MECEDEIMGPSYFQNSLERSRIYKMMTQLGDQGGDPNGWAIRLPRPKVDEEIHTRICGSLGRIRERNLKPEEIEVLTWEIVADLGRLQIYIAGLRDR